ncbi:conserved hypothetical protein [Austwickia chelonae]|uniref:DUF3090 domain-containing protein n=1 Tax=Austwickia chelonae NBRC 105200 TaxID=1184607 RepID=K6V4R0_9MICO|nr:DUF3090 family protein [Austwickia chelonae]GAB77138.1 hypothetical protein AUCHE_05_00430 [Austwickia chelonae NBRC 105200]SEW03595.1 conserved hypothetical protein [Austwickia chelonae]
MALISYDPPERFIVGTIGPTGQREFFLQASDGLRTTSVGVEKTQVSVLSDRVNDLLDEFAGSSASEQAAQLFTDDGPLATPVDAEFRVGTMGLSWDTDTRRLVLELHAVGDSFDTADVEELAETGELAEDPALDPTQMVLRVSMPAAMARAFARRGRKVVAAGRPQCPFCAGPIDPDGHICPRANGYRR